MTTLIVDNEMKVQLQQLLCSIKIVEQDLEQIKKGFSGEQTSEDMHNLDQCSEKQLLTQIEELLDISESNTLRVQELLAQQESLDGTLTQMFATFAQSKENAICEGCQSQSLCQSEKTTPSCSIFEKKSDDHKQQL